MLKQISLKEFEEKDYCFDLTDEKLSHDVNEYLEQVNDILAEPVTHLEALDMVESAKFIKVYHKDYLKLPIGFIEERIRDYMDDEYGCDYYELDILSIVDIEAECKAITEKINNSRYWYIRGSLVGYIDLSQQVRDTLNEGRKWI